MSYILSTLNQKGGVGKSTIAVNLAVFFANKKNRVLLIDADDNQNTKYWLKRRGDIKPKIDTLEFEDSSKLISDINKYQKNYDFIIIDGSPKISEVSMSIMLLSNLCIFPIKPSPFDYETTQLQFAPKFHEAKHFKPELKGCIVLNEVMEREKLTKETKEAIDGTGIPQIETAVKRYVGFRDSLMLGLGVIEYKHSESKDNISNLGKEIKQLLNN